MTMPKGHHMFRRLVPVTGIYRLTHPIEGMCHMWVVSYVYTRQSQWLKWFCEAGGGSPDEARLEDTPYPFQSH